MRDTVSRKKYDDLKRRFDYLRKIITPIFEYEDFGNYPKLVRTVKDVTIELCESEYMYD